MQIEIDMAAVANSINTRISENIAHAAISHETEAAIGQALAASFASGAIMKAVQKGCEEADVSAIAQAVTGEVIRTATKTAVLTMREAMVESVAKLRGVYNDADKARIRAELSQ